MADKDPILNTILEQLKNYLNSPEGQEDIKRTIAHNEFRKMILNKYLNKLYEMGADKRDKLFQKIKTKYDSDEYYHRWVDRGIEPPEGLYNYILEYGHKYGAENEIKDAHFGYDSYIIDNSWVITAWYGQGTAYNFDKVV